MSALDDAARDVAQAKERLVGFALAALPNEPGFEKTERFADALIAAVRRHDAEIARTYAEQDDGQLTTLCAATYVKGIRDTADRIQPEETP